MLTDVFPEIVELGRRCVADLDVDLLVYGGEVGVGRDEQPVAAAQRGAGGRFEYELVAAVVAFAGKGGEEVLAVGRVGFLADQRGEGGQQIDLADDGVGDSRLNLPFPVRDEGNAGTGLVKAVFTAAQRAVLIVVRYVSVGFVEIAVVKDGAVVAGQYDEGIFQDAGLIQ